MPAKVKFQVFAQIRLTYPRIHQPLDKHHSNSKWKESWEAPYLSSFILAPCCILSAQSSKTIFPPRTESLLSPHIPCLSRRVETARSGGGVRWETQNWRARRRQWEWVESQGACSMGKMPPENQGMRGFLHEIPGVPTPSYPNQCWSAFETVKHYTQLVINEKS